MSELNRITDPEEIRNAIDGDEEAEKVNTTGNSPLPEFYRQGEKVRLYRHPDGMFFEVSRELPCGTVVTDAGIWLSPEEFEQCKRYM